MKNKKYDFCGYATKNNVKCSDGRTIKPDAFKHNDGAVVPLVWQHMHDSPDNIVGHAVLENREDGVYCYCSFNSTTKGESAKELVKHGDITALSIYANQLIQKAKDVIHGQIREVSLVLCGANPGARIENVAIAHGDDSYEEVEDEAIIFGDELEHSDQNGSESEDFDEEGDEMEHSEKDKTVREIVAGMSAEQKDAMAYVINQIVNDNNVEHGESKGDDDMKNNLFAAETQTNKATLTHGDITTIFEGAKKCGSLRDSFLAHVGATYGIENIEVLFPDAQKIRTQPDIVSRKMEWVDTVISGAHKSPFSRIKSVSADITADEARAKGYVKGNLKVEGVISAAKRVTTPTTVYIKQKLDRDDIIDITDMDVVMFLKAQMRVLYDEELARAVLFGDGRAIDHKDKINETNIRPIWTDDAFYSVKHTLATNASAEVIIDEMLKARKKYKGTGNPTLFMSEDLLIDMLLIKDTTGRRIYPTQTELMAAMRVSKIVTVPLMDGEMLREGKPLVGILVNMSDYTLGADKGGKLATFDDFDIDYNQYKYLMEGRCSGTLTVPFSAVVIEKAAAGGQ